jgi:hypothetical protein
MSAAQRKFSKNRISNDCISSSRANEFCHRCNMPRTMCVLIETLIAVRLMCGEINHWNQESHVCEERAYASQCGRPSSLGEREEVGCILCVCASVLNLVARVDHLAGEIPPQDGVTQPGPPYKRCLCSTCGHQCTFQLCRHTFSILAALATRTTE